MASAVAIRIVKQVKTRRSIAENHNTVILLSEYSLYRTNLVEPNRTI